MDEEDAYGSSALHYAASRAHDNVVEVLLDNNAEVNKQNIGRETALHSAVGHVLVPRQSIHDSSVTWRMGDQERCVELLLRADGEARQTKRNRITFGNDAWASQAC